MEKITDDQLKKLKQSAGDDAINFAYATEKEWICVCGTYNPINDTKESVSCSNCERNRDFTLKYLSKPTQQESESKLTNKKNSNVEAYQFKTLLGYGKFISGFGWFVVIIGIITIIGGLVSGNEAGFGIAGGALVLIILGISMVISGQVISCFVSIEKNTRATYELLKEKQM